MWQILLFYSLKKEKEQIAIMAVFKNWCMLPCTLLACWILLHVNKLWPTCSWFKFLFINAECPRSCEFWLDILLFNEHLSFVCRFLHFALCCCAHRQFLYITVKIKMFSYWKLMYTISKTLRKYIFPILIIYLTNYHIALYDCMAARPKNEYRSKRLDQAAKRIYGEYLMRL